MVPRAERISHFISGRHPAHGAEVEVLCEDHVGTYTPPFLCRWFDGKWTHAATGAAIDADILGWREPSGRFAQGKRSWR